MQHKFVILWCWRWDFPKCVWQTEGLLQSEGRKEKDVAIFGSSERGSSIIQPTTKEEQELSEKLSLAPST